MKRRDVYTQWYNISIRIIKQLIYYFM